MVVVEEQTRSVQVPTGVWIVEEDYDAPACIEGQTWWSCIEDLTTEYNGACADRNLGDHSRTVCEKYFQYIQEAKALNLPADAMVEALQPNTRYPARLVRSEMTERRTIVEVPEVSREARCYLGFLGECDEAGSDAS